MKCLPLQQTCLFPHFTAQEEWYKNCHNILFLFICLQPRAPLYLNCFRTRLLGGTRAETQESTDCFVVCHKRVVGRVVFFPFPPPLNKNKKDGLLNFSSSAEQFPTNQHQEANMINTWHISRGTHWDQYFWGEALYTSKQCGIFNRV